MLGAFAWHDPLQIGKIIMSNLPLLIVVGVASVIALCYLHGQLSPAVPRPKFVVLTLMGVGAVPVSYTLMWVLAGQRPDFDLTPGLAFGLALWTTALVYAALVVLCMRDTAPSD